MTQDEFNALMRGFYRERGRKCTHGGVEILVYRLCTVGFFVFLIPALVTMAIRVMRFVGGLAL